MTSQDERAYMLMDRLFSGQAQTLKTVEREFKNARIPAVRDYLREYNVHVTREPIGGQIWAYMWDLQKKRVEDDVKAGEIVAKVLRLHDGDWSKIPVNAFQAWYGRTNMGFKARLGAVLKEMGVYIDGAIWEKHVPLGGWFVIAGKELSIDDRNWMFEELSFIESHYWTSPPSALWKMQSFMWEHRVTEAEFSRCFEIAKLHKTTDVKVIFGVGSSDGD